MPRSLCDEEDEFLGLGLISYAMYVFWPDGKEASRLHLEVLFSTILGLGLDDSFALQRHEVVPRSIVQMPRDFAAARLQTNDGELDFSR